MTCQHCQATTTNGLALCELCTMFASRCLELLPVYFVNLARWRPGRAGSRPVPGSREPSSGATAATDRVSVALDEVGNDLTTWARMLADDRMEGDLPASNDETASVRVACWFLGSHLTSVATLEWAGLMVVALADHEERLRNLTEQVAPGWYAGSCSLCQAATYVVPGLTWVTCRSCGSTTYARDHLDVVLSEARGWVAGPKEVAGVIVALIDDETSVPKLHDRIRKWQSLGWLTPVRKIDADGDAVGPKKYRLGDVLDLVQGNAEAPTRAKQSRRSA